MKKKSSFSQGISTGSNPKTVLKQVKRGKERKDMSFSKRVREKKSTTSFQKLA